MQCSDLCEQTGRGDLDTSDIIEIDDRTDIEFYTGVDPTTIPLPDDDENFSVFIDPATVPLPDDDDFPLDIDPATVLLPDDSPSDYDSPDGEFEEATKIVSGSSSYLLSIERNYFINSPSRSSLMMQTLHRFWKQPTQ